MLGTGTPVTLGNDSYRNHLPMTSSRALYTFAVCIVRLDASECVYFLPVPVVALERDL
jgi:hypothetical protein